MIQGKTSTSVVVVVFICHILAFSLAVVAEQRRSKARIIADENDEYNYCVYDADRATGLGIGAIVFLVIGETIIMCATKCLCCGRSLRPGGSRTWAIFLFFGALLTFTVAEACLLAGAAKNAYHTKYRGLVDGDGISCDTLRKGVFGAGAAFTLINLILSEFYYMNYTKSQEGGWEPYGRETEIGMSSF